MGLPITGQINYPTQDEILATLLRAIKLGSAQRGLTTVNVLPDSDHYIRAKSYASRVAIAIENNRIARAEFNPLTATGDNLIAIARVFGVSARAASRAAGYVTITGVGTITIPAGFQCTSPSGEKYQTTSAFTGTTGSPVQIQAVNGGTSTNLDAGAKVSWDLASIGNLNKIATVASGGVDGGFNADDDSRLRRRLLNKLAFPGVGGNVSQMQGWAEEASAAVEAAYVYAAVRGPGSYDIALTAEGGDRTLSAATTASVAAYVGGKMPGHADLNVTSVSGQEIDVVFAAVLALPASAGGSGGGWRNASPWPNATSGNVQITAWDSGTGIATTDATVANGLAIGTAIGVWEPGDEGTMHEYVVDSVVLAGTFDITVQGGFGFDPTGAYISTGAVNLASYGSTAAAQIALLGPGEKTSSTDILPRGRRQPTAELGAETDLNSRVTTAIQTTHTEIRSLEYAARYDTGTMVTRTAPSVPSTTADPPRILVLKHLCIRKA